MKNIRFKTLISQGQIGSLCLIVLILFASLSRPPKADPSWVTSQDAYSSDVSEQVPIGLYGTSVDDTMRSVSAKGGLPQRNFYRTTLGTRSILSVINSSTKGITFQFSTISPTIDLMVLDESKTTFHQLELPGYERLVAPVGYPDLPMALVMVGIPQTGNVSLRVVPKGQKVFRSINIAPVPKQSWDKTIIEKGAVYEQNRFLPQSLAEIKEIGFWRSVRVCKILVAPAQYNPITKELQVFETLTVSLQFTAEPQSHPELASPVFDPIYEKTLLNGNMAKDWKVPEPKKTSKNFYEISEPWLKIKVESTGVYKITYDDLKTFRINPNSINPKSFRLFNIGKWTSNVFYPDSMIELPIYVYGENDSVFDRSDYILFWAVGVSDWDSTRQVFKTNYFTNYNYYWLTWGGKNGKRIRPKVITNGENPQIVKSAKSKIHFEKDVLCPARSGLLWLWHYITKAADRSDTSLVIPFTLPNADSLLKLTFAFYQPATNLTANFNIYLNQTLIGSGQIRTASSAPYLFTLETLPALSSDDNTLRIQLTGSTEMQLYLDYFDVEYRQRLNLRNYGLDFSLDSGEVRVQVKGVRQTPFIFDVTDKFEPQWITDFTLTGDSLFFQITNETKRFYYITDITKLKRPIALKERSLGSLKSETNSADYIIIAPDELYDAAKLLARYRTNNILGLPQARAWAVKLSDVYDEYAFGIEEPGAIKEFFKNKLPSFGLLLGDATYDYRNNLGFNDFPVLPAYEQGFDFDPDVYSQAALAIDVYYARLDDDQIPDMILGRVTARTTIEVQRFFQKVKEYDAKPFGFWNTRLLLLADDEWKGRDKPDDGMIWTHIIDCDAIAGIFQNRLEPVKIYLTEYPFAPGNEYAKPQARASFIQALNQGALLLAYFGHGAGWQLAHEKAFYVEEDVVKVQNERRNPFAFFGSCGVGRFEDTRFQAIAEELVREDDGCIGTVGATKATSSGTNLYFASAMFGYINDTTNLPVSIGQAFFSAWHYDYKYHLFGDPATVLNLPELKAQRLSITPDTLRLGELCTVSLPPLGVQSGSYYLTAFGPKWLRTYSSYFYGRINTVNYQLPGFELFRGIGQCNQSGIEIPFIVPRGQSPYMRGEGYTPIANSARIQLGLFSQENFYCLLKDSIPITYDTAPRTDTTGPIVNLYADGEYLRNGSKVPNQFILSGTVYDPSGILILPNTTANCSLFFYDPSSRSPVGLSQYFIYSNNSYTQGQFVYPSPIKLTKDLDTLVVIAYDCQLNQTEKRVWVNLLSEGLEITNALVYPNPVKTETYFTFTLSRDCYVQINIYTINGRPVKTIPERLCSRGYNQIKWDGRDDTGVLPANGVYLYQIKAKLEENRSQESSTTFTDKLLILR
uniref:T9SS type A sorting domain-containing protein n=1 Tax=candidate division WOR-3 bacterium TaxID=2052148 RepID=A0A7C6EDH3_UNCW3